VSFARYALGWLVVVMFASKATNRKEERARVSCCKSSQPVQADGIRFVLAVLLCRVLVIRAKSCLILTSLVEGLNGEVVGCVFVSCLRPSRSPPEVTVQIDLKSKSPRSLAQLWLGNIERSCHPSDGHTCLSAGLVLVAFDKQPKAKLHNTKTK
jgi:hypothetical protein